MRHQPGCDPSVALRAFGGAFSKRAMIPDSQAAGYRFLSFAARSSPETRDSMSSSSVALAAWLNTLSAALTLVHAGVFEVTTKTLSRVVTARARGLLKAAPRVGPSFGP